MKFLKGIFSRNTSETNLPAPVEMPPVRRGLSCNSIDEIAMAVHLTAKKNYQINGKAAFKDDTLVMLGLDQQLEERFRRGEEPTMLVDDIMLCMIECNSLRGVRICVDAGADPMATDSVPGGLLSKYHGIGRAEALGHHEIAEFLNSYIETSAYRQRMAQREANDWNTVYTPGFHLTNG
jgi:hypothetical protein